MDMSTKEANSGLRGAVLETRAGPRARSRCRSSDSPGTRRANRDRAPERRVFPKNGVSFMDDAAEGFSRDSGHAFNSRHLGSP